MLLIAFPRIWWKKDTSNPECLLFTCSIELADKMSIRVIIMEILKLRFKMILQTSIDNLENQEAIKERVHENLNFFEIVQPYL